MAKVSVFFDKPSINKYYEGDEEIPRVEVCTFEKAKELIKENLLAYLERLDKLDYHTWKNHQDIL